MGYIFLLVSLSNKLTWIVDMVNFTLLHLDVCLLLLIFQVFFYDPVELFEHMFGVLFEALLGGTRAAFSLGLILLYY